MTVPGPCSFRAARRQRRSPTAAAVPGNRKRIAPGNRRAQNASLCRAPSSSTTSRSAPSVNPCCSSAAAARAGRRWCRRCRCRRRPECCPPRASPCPCTGAPAGRGRAATICQQAHDRPTPGWATAPPGVRTRRAATRPRAAPSARRTTNRTAPSARGPSACGRRWSTAGLSTSMIACRCSRAAAGRFAAVAGSATACTPARAARRRWPWRRRSAARPRPRPTSAGHDSSTSHSPAKLVAALKTFWPSSM